uniref:Uncharacterized protein n=1 Tax=Brassica campestris TaxID=3711 RepID=M4DM16_BRACM
MAAKDEDGNDGFLKEMRDLAQLMQDILSQDPPVDEVESNQGEKKGTSNHQLSGLSTTYKALVAYKSDVANGETKSVPERSGEAMSLPSSSSDQANVEIKKRVPITSGKTATLLRPMADVLKTSLGFSSEECLTEARPVKEDSYLHEKQTATKASSSNASTESSDAKRDQVGDSDLASKYKLPDDEEVTNPIDYSSSDYDVVRYLLSLENDDSKEYASLKQCMTKTDSFSLDHPKPEQAQYGAHEHASDFTFDIRKPVINPAQAPPKPSLQRQNAMHRQRHTSELDPGYSASFLNQPMPTSQSITTTASSHGRRPSVSMTKALITSTEFVPQTQRNQQAMNSQWQYGNMTNSLYTAPNQNERYIMPPSATPFQQQQQGGSNIAHNGNMITWRPEQNDSYNILPQSDASVAPYAYGSVNLFGTSSDNVAADSMFGYEGGVSRNHFSSLQQHQRGDSNMWPPSSRRSRQQRQQQLRSDFFATLNQQNDRSDPSDQTQQQLWPRDN